MTEPGTSIGRGGLGTGALLTATTIVVAASGYLVLLLAAPALGAARYALFAAFWSAAYLGVGAVFGMQQETTRVASVRRSSGPIESGPRILTVSIIVGVFICLVIAATSFLWAPSAFGPDAPAYVALVCLAVVAYAGHTAVAGGLAGVGRWRPYSALLTTEALARLALILIAVALHFAEIAFAVATVAAMLCWVAFLLSPGVRSATSIPADRSFAASLGNYLRAAGGAASSAFLVTGFPLVLSVLSPDADRAALGVAILVVTLTRAPLLVPLNAALSFLVSRLSGADSTMVWPMLRRPAGAIVGGAVVVAAVSFWLGSPVLALLFGPDFTADPLFIALCAMSSGVIALLTLTGIACLALDKHSVYLLGWIAAAAASAALLLVPADLTIRIVISLMAGPIVGLIIHSVGLAHAVRLRSV